MAVEIVMPRLSDSMEEGTIVSWLVAEGDQVSQGQPLAEIETDKATVTYEADEAGVILSLSAGEGETVAVGAAIAFIGEAGEDVPVRAAAGSGVGGAARSGIGAAAGVAADAGSGVAASGAATEGATRSGVAAQTPSVGVASLRPKASPLARRIAAELNIDLATLTGSGPSGRVIRADVERAAAAGNGELQAPPGTPALSAAKGDSTVHELTRLQRTVARRMSESRATVPDIELRVEVDMGEAVALREQLRSVTEPVPSVNDFVVKAVALALRDFPRVNGAYRDGAIETHSRINVGVAVAAENALVVPTIFDADTRSLGDISRAARELAARVRDGSVTPAELSGGTFTVSNLGMYGVDSFSAVINVSQAAILAVGALKRRPVVVEPSGEIVARPTMILTLACDHRILYGVDGAQFLARVRELLEQPLALLL